MPRWLQRQPLPDALPIPVDGVEKSQLVDTFGAPRSGGRSHEGIDIFAPRNTRIRSTTEGIVLRKVKGRLGGFSVTVLGPGGSRHYYAHMDHWAKVKVGKRIEAGAVLGFVGNSGNASGGSTHLHYAIELAAGQPLNAYDYLVRGPGAFR